MKAPRLKKYQIDCEMTISGYRIIEAFDYDDAEEQAENYKAGISTDEFFSSFEVESMPSTEVLWVTEQKRCLAKKPKKRSGK